MDLVEFFFLITSDKTFQATKQSIQVAQGRPSGITISAAKYSSEDCATLVQYTIAIVEYTRRCLPLKTATERMNELEREIEENERQQKQAEQEVRNTCPYFIASATYYCNLQKHFSCCLV